MRRIAIRAGDRIAGAIVVEGREVDNGLREMGAKIDVIKGADDLGNGEALEIETEAEGAQDLRFPHFRRLCRLMLGSKAALRGFGLAFGLTQGLGGAGLAEVIGECAEDGFLKAELAVKGHKLGGGSAAGVDALSLHGGIESVDAGGDAGDR